MGTNRYARFYALQSRLPGMEKDTLVRQYTNGRTMHLHEMAADEYRAMCEAMSRMIAHTDWWKSTLRELRRLRSIALHQMQLLGVDTADWGKVNAFCLDPRIAGLAFRDLNHEELEALTRKLRVIRRKREE